MARTKFSSEEEAAIIQGYTKYGPKWTLIKLDSDLSNTLQNRSAEDIRFKWRNLCHKIGTQKLYKQIQHLRRSAASTTATPLPSSSPFASSPRVSTTKQRVAKIKSSRLQHGPISPSPKTLTWECDVCGKVFLSLAQLSGHRGGAHFAKRASSGNLSSSQTSVASSLHLSNEQRRQSAPNLQRNTKQHTNHNDSDYDDDSNDVIANAPKSKNKLDKMDTAGDDDDDDDDNNGNNSHNNHNSNHNHRFNTLQQDKSGKTANNLVKNNNLNIIITLSSSTAGLRLQRDSGPLDSEDHQSDATTTAQGNLGILILESPMMEKNGLDEASDSKTQIPSSTQSSSHDTVTATRRLRAEGSTLALPPSGGQESPSNFVLLSVAQKRDICPTTTTVHFQAQSTESLVSFIKSENGLSKAAAATTNKAPCRSAVPKHMIPNQIDKKQQQHQNQRQLLEQQKKQPNPQTLTTANYSPIPSFVCASSSPFRAQQNDFRIAASNCCDLADLGLTSLSHDRLQQHQQQHHHFHYQQHLQVDSLKPFSVVTQPPPQQQQQGQQQHAGG
eukprot:c12056_g5_i1.p1 GENE.c12056_g5_i1~~c12056_g5_i1.p1  ORF type:complete len:555 (+),score=135.95 c12056_g5_i1:74-1738(+)